MHAGGPSAALHSLNMSCNTWEHLCDWIWDTAEAFSNRKRQHGVYKYDSLSYPVSFNAIGITKYVIRLQECWAWGVEFPVEGMHCVTSYINILNLCECFRSCLVHQYQWLLTAIFHGCQEVNSRNSRVICRLAADADRELPACTGCSNSSRRLCHCSHVLFLGLGWPDTNTRAAKGFWARLQLLYHWLLM